ncbi:hypothetical protein ACU5B6_26720 [Moritella viscosa]|uniref:hypothetical protein n=1 Tax=Moritella viscosa TaxID=80854 RepID=UPI00091CC924|nr:hypothetical protein [Moritella viscosa]SHO15809.1 Putative uncharacterized protein [Moritella viscosa]SHO15819.1 Putative uncharacterized protein [Moritella viscosa]SHO19021.1 Putative uncharacterized protein [Moritella viscosa]
MRYESRPSSHIPKENQETTKERALRQKLERRAELTYTASDYQRWAKHRNRVIAEREKEKADAKLLANEIKTKNDIDDTYIIFADEKMALNDFAKEVYLSDAPEIIEHINNLNPHLKKTSYNLIKGMPLVVSPWQNKHEDEGGATNEVRELADEFLTLNDEQQAWFFDHNGISVDILLASASVNAKAIKAGDDGQPEEFDYLGQAISSLTAGVLAADSRVKNYIKLMGNYEEQLKVASQELAGVTGNALRSHPAAKLVRTQMREFEIAWGALSNKIGLTSFMDDFQVKKINNLLGLGKKQIYKAGDFAKAINGLAMTKVYKKVMDLGRNLNTAGKSLFLIGVKDNLLDMYHTCQGEGELTLTCSRSIVKNGSSIGINYITGEAIAWAGYGLAPSTSGISIGAAIGATYAWGVHGSEPSNKFGDGMEYFVFDVVGKSMEIAIETAKEVVEWTQ